MTSTLSRLKYLKAVQQRDIYVPVVPKGLSFSNSANISMTAKAVNQHV